MPFKVLLVISVMYLSVKIDKILNITGDFKDAAVYVYNNYLPRFEESVFGPILQQMVSGKLFVGGEYDAGSICFKINL